ncbi:MAG: hypothetical protein Q9219_004851 [cf. Caloplaca sp. 3 TL-2023]
MTLLQGTLESLNSSEPFHPIKDCVIQDHNSQSAVLLPFEFDIFLDAKLAKSDAFYALHNIFQHAAYSEMQVLNLLDARIRHEVGVLTVEDHRSHSLENLQYFILFLDRHIEHISRTLRTVKDRGGRGWPSRFGKDKRVATSTEQLQRDFEGLFARALDLRKQCTEGMGVMMNRAVVAESRKAIEQAERVKKITLLATFFIPLFFVTSLFGMNFRQLGTGSLSIWLFATVCIPVLLTAYVAFVWDGKIQPSAKDASRNHTAALGQITTPTARPGGQEESRLPQMEFCISNLAAVNDQLAPETVGLPEQCA